MSPSLPRSRSSSRSRRLAVLAGALALVAAGSARAQVTEKISGPTTLSGTPVSNWSSDSTKAGDVGAGFTTTTSMTADTSGNFSQTGDSSARVMLFDDLMTVAESQAIASQAENSTPDGNFEISFAGALAFEDPADALTASELMFELCSEDLPDSVKKYLGTKEVTVEVGPVPVTITAGFDACAGVSAEVESTQNTGTPTLDVQITPFVNTALLVEAGVGTGPASAGVYVSFTLLDLSVPITLAESLDLSTNTLTHGVSGKLTLSALSGSLGLYAKLFFIKYEYKLISWSGITLANVLLFTDSVPEASDVQAGFSGRMLYGNYVYYDSADLDDQSTYQWWRASTSDGSDGVYIDNHLDHDLTADDDNKYMRFCVTPDNGKNKGTQVCSDYLAVGPLIRLFKNASLGGSEIDIPYMGSYSGKCFDLGDGAYNFDNMLSSLEFTAPTASDATLSLFADGGCSGTTYSQTVSAGSSATLSDLRTIGMNDEVSSFRVVTSDNVGVSDVGVQAGPGYIQGTYTFEDDNGLDESGTTYGWYKEKQYANGEISWTPLGTSMTLPVVDTHDYQNAELEFCVTPSDGYATGGIGCYQFNTGNEIDLYPSANDGGSYIVLFPHLNQDGICLNLSDGSFDNLLSSFDCYSPYGSADCNTVETAFSTSAPGMAFALYKDADCTGASLASSQYGEVSDLSTLGWSGQASSIYLAMSGDVPTVSNVTLTLGTNEVVGSYTFSDTNSIPEDGSVLSVQRSDTGTGDGTNVTEVSTNNSHYLSAKDNGEYLRFCVTPTSEDGTTGSQVCSSWVSVGHLAMLYSDVLGGTTTVGLAYENSADPTCFNLSDYGLDNAMSSLDLYATSGYATVLAMYQSAGCTGSYITATAGAGSMTEVQSIHSSYGSAWNDSISSVRVIWNDVPRGPAAAISISGNRAVGSYSYTDNLGLSESGSTYAIKRSSSANGQDVTTVGTGTSYTLTSADNGMYLRFCVYPSDGYVIGTTDCSGWTPVGHLMDLYQDNLGGTTNAFVAYENSEVGHCFDMADYGMDNILSSFIFNTPATTGNGQATVWFYQDANCSGSSATITEPADTSYSMYSMSSSMGAGWNDSVSSFKVTW